MNCYASINPTIIKIVNKYVSKFCAVPCSFEKEDLQQQLMFEATQALNKYNPRQGSISAFLNKHLHLKVLELKRAENRNMRKVALYTSSIESVSEIDSIHNRHDTDNRIMFNYVTNFLPSDLIHSLEQLKFRKKFSKSTPKHNAHFRILQKFFHCFSKIRGCNFMKNIACIDALSVRELSKLSEADLFDLSGKIKETENWIKQLSEKFELALQAKYMDEAKKKLTENGLDFGSCNLQKNSYSVSVQLPKKVTWDQNILARVYNVLDEDVRNKIFKVTFGVSEKEYAKMSDNMKQSFDPARTLNYGKIKITINQNEEPANENN